MKASEFKSMDVAVLKKTLLELQKKVSDMRFTSATTKTKDVKELRNARKDIARIFTALRQNNQ